MVAALNVQPWAAYTRYMTLHALRRVLTDLHHLGAPPLDQLVPMPPRPKPRPVTVPRSVLDTLLGAAPAHLQLLLLLCHDAALRARTALNLTHREYDPDTQTIRTRTKRGQVVAVPASGRLAALLKLVPKGDGPLVSLLAGRVLGYAGLRRQFVELCATVGAPPGLRLHDLRRTMAHATYDTTHDLRVVQALLGHDSLAVTLQYLESHVRQVRRADLLAALGESNK